MGSTATDSTRTRASAYLSGPDRVRVASVVGGGALAVFGLSRRSAPGVGLAVAGGGLVVHGLTRTAAGVPGERGIAVERAVTVNRPVAQLFEYWRDFTNLPRFMDHLESVTPLDDRRSHWKAEGPLGSSVEWDAEIAEERPNELIAWRSLEGARVPNNGSVRFAPAPGDRGTIVTVNLTYDPPAGPIGAAVAKLFGEEPDQQVREDLRRFKRIMEAGEVPTITGQTSGREN